VALPFWPVRAPVEGGAFTTVMAWDSYPAITVGNLTLGLKSRSFGPYFDLPRRTSAPLEMAAGGATLPRAELEAEGWRIVDPREPTRSLQNYERYIEGSLGEFSVAKHGYVATGSGWFSERSANYLASGRPVITQETGFSHLFECGRGLLAFSTPEEAVEALDAVRGEYAMHCREARAVAERYFDARLVLTDLLDRAFAG
jgi:hypothetical protein